MDKHMVANCIPEVKWLHQACMLIIWNPVVHRHYRYSCMLSTIVVWKWNWIKQHVGDKYVVIILCHNSLHWHSQPVEPVWYLYYPTYCAIFLQKMEESDSKNCQNFDRYGYLNCPPFWFLPLTLSICIHRLLVFTSKRVNNYCSKTAGSIYTCIYGVFTLDIWVLHWLCPWAVIPGSHIGFW